jgi:hypothetical protein
MVLGEPAIGKRLNEKKIGYGKKQKQKAEERKRS